MRRIYSNNNLTVMVEIDKDLSLEDAIDVACYFGSHNGCRAQFTKGGQTFRCFSEGYSVVELLREQDGVWERYPYEHSRWTLFREVT